jgi:hypothetical protein
VAIDGTLLVGTGIGALDAGESAEITARTPSSLVALCVSGSKGCPKGSD